MDEEQFEGRDVTAPRLARTLQGLASSLSQDLLGGPRPWKLAWVINFQKAGTLPFVLLLMWWAGDFSTDAWVYLGLHGSYGLLWLMKDLAFPDRNWQRRVTIAGGLMAFLLVLGPYWLFPVILIVQPFGPIPEAEPWLLGTAITVYAVGVGIMLSADAQKHFTLRVQHGLITDGLHRYVRHPNYLGEIMVYGSFALLVRHWLPWVVLAAIWLLVFWPNMAMKEHSMSRYEGWPAYRRRTGWLLPKLW